MYIKFSPNDYVFRYRKGKVVAEGLGLSFFFLERNTSVSAVPVSGTDMDFIFEETTKDFQTVTVQGQLSCKFIDCAKAVKALDFTVDLKTGNYPNNPMQKLNKRMVNIARVLLKSHIGSMDLTEAIQSSQPLAEAVLQELQANAECGDMGISVNGFSILQVKANPETTRALEAHTRESILKESDDALYQRRNASIEQERGVKENELNTEISVAEKKKNVQKAELNTRRMMLEGNNDLERMKTQSETEQEQIRLNARIALERTRTQNETELAQLKLDAQIEMERKRQELADLRLANAKKDADAEAYRIGAVMEAYNKLSAEVLVALATLNMEPEKMIAQAFQKMADNTGKIGTLNITPDLLESLKVRK